MSEFTRIWGRTMPPTKPCGTAAAARRHYANNEPLCEQCHAALRRQYARGNARSGRGEGMASVPAYEIEVRNGLPEFRPYVYRGTGYDVLEAAG